MQCSVFFFHTDNYMYLVFKMYCFHIHIVSLCMLQSALWKSVDSVKLGSQTETVAWLLTTAVGRERESSSADTQRNGVPLTPGRAVHASAKRSHPKGDVGCALTRRWPHRHLKLLPWQPTDGVIMAHGEGANLAPKGRGFLSRRVWAAVSSNQEQLRSGRRAPFRRLTGSPLWRSASYSRCATWQRQRRRAWGRTAAVSGRTAAVRSH